MSHKAGRGACYHTDVNGCEAVVKEQDRGRCNNTHVRLDKANDSADLVARLLQRGRARGANKRRQHSTASRLSVFCHTTVFVLHEEAPPEEKQLHSPGQEQLHSLNDIFFFGTKRR